MFFDIGVNDKLFRPFDFMLTGGKYSTYESYLSVYLIPEVAINWIFKENFYF